MSLVFEVEHGKVKSVDSQSSAQAGDEITTEENDRCITMIFQNENEKTTFEASDFPSWCFDPSLIIPCTCPHLAIKFSVATLSYCR